MAPKPHSPHGKYWRKALIKSPDERVI